MLKCKNGIANLAVTTTEMLRFRSEGFTLTCRSCGPSALHRLPWQKEPSRAVFCEQNILQKTLLNLIV